MAMQTLVMAHAAFGHNHFFRNNHLFRQWTDAEAILDYLEFCQSYIARCEERYGSREVERLLDAAHALMDQGVNRYHRKRRSGPRWSEERERAAAATKATTTSGGALSPAGRQWSDRRNAGRGRKGILDLPEENILYFLEKNAPAALAAGNPRIVRQLAQYFPRSRPR